MFKVGSCGHMFHQYKSLFPISQIPSVIKTCFLNAIKSGYLSNVQSAHHLSLQSL